LEGSFEIINNKRRSINMKLKRTRYYTMNSWNLSTSLAYNLKVYNVIPDKYLDRVYELMEIEGFYDDINFLIGNFDESFNYEWQAGFNGRSGGYLVLYRGGKNKDGSVYSRPGLNIEDAEVPAEVKKAFRQLAVNIVKTTIDMAKSATIETGTYTKEYKYIAS
jgi:hypothetical protein